MNDDLLLSDDVLSADADTGTDEDAGGLDFQEVGIEPEDDDVDFGSDNYEG